MITSQNILLWVNDITILPEAVKRLQEASPSDITIKVVDCAHFSREQSLETGFEAVRAELFGPNANGTRSSGEVFVLTDSHICGVPDGGFQLLRKLGVGKTPPFSRGVVCSERIVPDWASDQWAEFGGYVIPVDGRSHEPSLSHCFRIVRFFQSGQTLGLSPMEELISRVETALGYLSAGFRDKPSLDALDGWRSGVRTTKGITSIELFRANEDFADYYKESLPESLGIPMNNPTRRKAWARHWHNWRHAFCPFQSLYAAANKQWPDEVFLAELWNQERWTGEASGVLIKGGGIRGLVEMDALRANGGEVCPSIIARATCELDGVQRDWVTLQYDRLQAKLKVIHSANIWFTIQQAHQECVCARELIHWLRDNGAKV